MTTQPIWLRSSLRVLASLTVAACLGCPGESPAGSNAGEAGGGTTSATADAPPPIEDQIQEAGIDAAALETTAEAEAETITAEDADAVLTDLESSLADEGE